MSTRPTPPATPSDRPAVTIPRLQAMKAAGEPIVMVTAYDFPSGRAAELAGVDVVLVGDSGAMTVLGYPDTVSVTVDEMIMLAAAARRSVRTPFLVVDLPFGSYEISDEQAVANAIRVVKEAHADAVKLEGGGVMSVSRAAAVVRAGIPVMGHVGLTPQTATALGGFLAQGRSVESALAIAAGAQALQDVGCFALVFEAIPGGLTEAIMPTLRVPVIGIGAGPHTDGQVLVFHDLLGIRDGSGARFVRRYADLQHDMTGGVAAYAQEVRSRIYPAKEHTYGASAAVLTQVRERLATGDIQAG